MERDEDREYDPIPDDERIEPLVDGDDAPAPPPTLDPDERIEVDDEEDEVLPDDERPV